MNKYLNIYLENRKQFNSRWPNLADSLVHISAWPNPAAGQWPSAWRLVTQRVRRPERRAQRMAAQHHVEEKVAWHLTKARMSGVRREHG
jgi:hypothetical protein